MSKARLKVLHVCTGFPFQFAGGITNYLRTLVGSLAAMGIDQDVICGLGSEAEVPNACRLIIHPSQRRVGQIDLATDSKETAWFEGVFRGGYNLVHVHSSTNVGRGFYEALLASGIPYVLSLHDYYFLCPRTFMTKPSGVCCRSFNLQACSRCVGTLDRHDFTSRVFRRLRLPLPYVPSTYIKKRADFMRELLRRSSAVLAVSGRVSEIYQTFEPAAPYIIETIGSASVGMPITLKTRSELIRVGFLGTVNKHKGGDLACQLAKNTSNARISYQFYGKCDAYWRKRLEAAGFTVNGPYRPAELSAVISRIDLGMVLPVWEDNGPQVVMELINQKTPVLGTRVGGIPDFVSHKTGFLFHPDHPEEIASAVSWLNLLDHAGIARLAQSISPLKSPSEHAENVIKLYRQI